MIQTENQFSISVASLFPVPLFASFSSPDEDPLDRLPDTPSCYVLEIDARGEEGRELLARK